ncbi:hypothetical protein [Nannocystis punicea]|uniref:Uncharacterized protein n=1 Tax=Nannocystis punicea TaxID=2995304 RepID=A0ABY7HES7_9BACT|nr:hypothetical protein [Nannocystis poenicansa]WAS97783.1 hypothetical protein O0S08_16695 [Nannocystis poenicansa]
MSHETACERPEHRHRNLSSGTSKPPPATAHARARCDAAHSDDSPEPRGRPRALALANDRAHLAAMSPALALLVSLTLVRPAAPPPARELPPAMPLSGLGLLVSAGVAGGLGLTAHVLRIGLLRRGCNQQFVWPELQVAVTSCIDESLRYLGYSTVAPMFNLAALGLAAGGGTVRGRFSAWNRARHDRRERTAAAYLGAGTGLLAVGLATYIGSRVALWRDRFGAETCRREGQLTADCVRDRWSTWLVLTATGQALTIAGAGLLAYGVSYVRGARVSRLRDLRIEPSVSGRFVGLTVAGRF